MSMDAVVSSLAIVVGAFLFLRLRASARVTNTVRVRQLEEAASLLALHAQALDRFIGDDAPSDVLKRVLIQCSDAMVDREGVRRMAEMISSWPMDGRSHGDDGQQQELSSGLATLGITHPHLVDDFHCATATAIVGSVLRWPESAALFEQIGARVAAESRGKAGLAIVAASYGRDSSFGFSARPHAMA